MPSTLVIVRHGESTWNQANLFTGWHDVPLSPAGEVEATAAGATLLDAGLWFDVVHTSLLTRATQTAERALAALGQPWLPVERSWRLNERHYGALQGLNKAETAAKHGEAQVKIWRRSYDIPPPPLGAEDPRHPRLEARYATVAASELPATESLKDTLARVLPYWHARIAPELRRGHNVMVVAHGNSLRAMVKMLDGVSDAQITELNIPTGVPLLYELDAQLKPRGSRYLGDAAAIAAAAEAVKRQAEQR
jgi:2,3-bisphosphoglycerate-dependent phosphoglycerate mutase